MMLTLIAVACSFVVSFILFFMCVGYYKSHKSISVIDPVLFAASCAYLFWFLT